MPLKGQKTLVTQMEDRIIAARALLAEGRTAAADAELVTALGVGKTVDKREVKADPTLRRKRAR